MPSIRPIRHQKPSKPYASFPLTAHNNGQRCKKIRGKVRFFGVWDDPQTALDNYLCVASDLHAGRLPSCGSIRPDGLCVKELCNHFLTYQMRKAAAGEIGERWFEDCRRVIAQFARFVGSDRCISDLDGDDFQGFRQSLITRGLGEKGTGLGLHALTRAITVVKGIFKYAYDMGMIDRPVRYGRAFEKPSTVAMRRRRQAADKEHGKRLFSRDQIHAILETAPMPLSAMILLGLNGGFGNTDCARLPMAAVEFDDGLINFARFKTGIERIVPLWSETLAALDEVMATRLSPRDEEAEGLLFLTPSGLPWVRQRAHRTESHTISKIVLVDELSRQFGKLLAQLGLKRQGLGFYALRHTFRTWADETKDQHAIHRIMGHAIPGMSGIYVEEIGLDRLRAVVNHVHSKLFGSGV